MIIKILTLNPWGDQSRTDASTKVHQKFCINLRLTIKNAKESNYCIKEIYVAWKKIKFKICPQLRLYRLTGINFSSSWSNAMLYQVQNRRAKTKCILCIRPYANNLKRLENFLYNLIFCFLLFLEKIQICNVLKLAWVFHRLGRVHKSIDLEKHLIVLLNSLLPEFIRQM